MRLQRARQTPGQKCQSANATVRVEGAFQIAYERTWGVRYFQQNIPRDRAYLKGLIDTYGEPVVLTLIESFFLAVRPIGRGGDPVVSRARHADIADFRHHVPYLVLQPQRGPRVTARTAENLHECAKAMGLTR
jgi:hypothetical protein